MRWAYPASGARLRPAQAYGRLVGMRTSPRIGLNGAMVSRRTLLALGSGVLVAGSLGGCAFIPPRDLRSRGVAKPLLTERFGTRALGALRIEGAELKVLVDKGWQVYTRAAGWQAAPQLTGTSDGTFTLDQVKLGDPAKLILSTGLTLDTGVLVVEGIPDGLVVYAEGIDDTNDPAHPEDWKPLSVEQRMLTPKGIPVRAPDTVSVKGLQTFLAELQPRCNELYSLHAVVGKSAWSAVARTNEGEIRRINYPTYAVLNSERASAPGLRPMPLQLNSKGLMKVVTRAIDALSHGKVVIVSWDLTTDGMVVYAGDSVTRAPNGQKVTADVNGENIVVQE